MTHTRYNQRGKISFMSGVAFYFNFFMCQSVLTTKPRRDGTAKYVLEFLRNYRRVEISYQTFYLPELFLLLTTCSLIKYASLAYQSLVIFDNIFVQVCDCEKILDERILTCSTGCQISFYNSMKITCGDFFVHSTLCAFFTYLRYIVSCTFNYSVSVSQTNI